MPASSTATSWSCAVRTSADNGDMVAALLANEESEATVKHFSRRGGHVQLLPDNPAFDPIDGDQAQILGKVVAVLRRLR